MIRYHWHHDLSGPARHGQRDIMQDELGSLICGGDGQPGLQQGVGNADIIHPTQWRQEIPLHTFSLKATLQGTVQLGDKENKSRLLDSSGTCQTNYTFNVNICHSYINSLYMIESVFQLKHNTVCVMFKYRCIHGEEVGCHHLCSIYSIMGVLIPMKRNLLSHLAVPEYVKLTGCCDG